MKGRKIKVRREREKVKKTEINNFLQESNERGTEENKAGNSFSTQITAPGLHPALAMQPLQN